MEKSFEKFPKSLQKVKEDTGFNMILRHFVELEKAILSRLFYLTMCPTSTNGVSGI